MTRQPRLCVPREMLLLVGALSACATTTPSSEPAVATRTRNPHVIRVTPQMERWYCGDAEHPPGDASAELNCGDFLALLRHDVPTALRHWQHSYSLATSRDQQCRAVARIVKNSLTPESNLGGASPEVLADCRERVADRRQRQLLQGQRDLDASICETARVVCERKGSFSPSCRDLAAECR